ncbi:MAG: glycosyltransferase [Deltaproteobacteria bacterium]|nr:glycosyltransferase [Deltaproteobacteria bacterium]
MNLLALLPSVHLPTWSAVAQAAQVLLALFAASGAFLLGCQIAMLLGWRKRLTPPVPSTRPAVSILRPLAGFDDDTELLLEVAVAALGPTDELVLGVASERDPAYPIAQRVQARYAEQVRLVLTNPAAAINPKVAQLIGMTAVAKGEIFVVSDANVRLPAGYLDDLAAHLADPAVGLCTHPVCGEGAETLGAWLDVLHLGSGIGGGVVAAKLLSGQDIVVGKSMAMRSSTLQALGGWRSFAEVLAEDYVFGRRLRDELGLGVAISSLVVVQVSRTRSVAAFYDRFGRWGTMQRFAVGLPIYMAQGLLTPVVLALAAVAISPTVPAFILLAVVWSVRLITDLVSLRTLRGEMPSLLAWPIVPLRELIVFVCWFRGLVVHHVVWRGHRLQVTDGTILRPMPARARSRFSLAR